MRVNRALTYTAFLVVVAGCTNGAGNPQSRTSAHRSVPPPPAVTAGQLAGGRWVPLPPAPIPGRDFAGTAWTGSQMLVWGGYQRMRRGCYQSRADGASYTPATRRWRVLPPAPLVGRAPAVSLWDGREFLVWGGATGFGRPCKGIGSGPAGPQPTADGAVFSPKLGSWRRLPAAPLPPSSFGQAVLWRQMVVVAVMASAGAEVAAYLPVSNRWLRLPSIPARAGTYFADLELVAAGPQLLLWATWSVSQFPQVTGSTERPLAGVRLFVYQPGQHRWVLRPAAGGPRYLVFSPVWTGREVLVQAGDQTCSPAFSCIGAPPSAQHGFAYQPITNTWSALPRGPVDGLSPQPQVWTGAALLAFDSNADITRYPLPGSAAAYDPSTGRWLRLRTAPYIWTVPAAVWTGRQLLIWGAAYHLGHPATDHLGNLNIVPGLETRGLAFVPLVPGG